MVSFPKKSYFKQNEVLSILGISSVELRSKTKNSFKSFFSENGQKIYLREDIVSLYAQSDELFLADTTDSVVSKKKEQKLSKYRNQFQEALDLISQIKSDHSEIWNTLQ